MRSARLSIGLVLGMQGLAACGDGGSAAAVAGTEVTGRELLESATTFQTCGGLTAPAVKPKGFSFFLNNFSVGLKPHHGAQDAIGNPGAPVSIHAWYGYGIPEAALMNERVSVQMDACQGWENLTTLRTNDGGFINIPVSGDRVGLGAFDVLHTVLADGTTMRSSVWGLPAGTHLVVFDIDGTLTTDNGQFIDEYAAEIFDAGYTPKAFAGAAELTKTWVAKGYVPVFLTGRPHNTADITRAWLSGEGFAAGPLHVTETAAQVASTNAGVGTYKAQFLADLLARGYSVDYAYGNEPTDVYAYKQIGVEPAHMFTIGSKAGVDGSTAIQGDYTAHVKTFVAAQPDAEQPFSF